MMVKKANVFLFFCAWLVTGAVTAQTLDYKKELATLQESIEKHFYITGEGFYKETAHPEKDSRPYSYMWPLCALFQARNEMEKLQPGSNYVAPVFQVIQKYYNPAAPAPGYASYAMKGGGGTRFYDDNQWIGITAMDAWFRTRQSSYLQTGQEIYRFMMTAYDNVTGGGLYWEEGDKKTKNTCSNGPGIILALQLYKATGNKTYLDTALLLYRWVNKTLRAPSGLYYDNIKIPSNTIGKQFYSYNTGTMLQSNVYLYELTKEPAYLKEAIALADSAAAFFLSKGKLDNYWFSAVLLRGYQHLLQYHADPKYTMLFRAALDRALLENKNENGLMGKRREQNLVAQGGMLEILARYVWMEQHLLPAPSTDNYDVVIYGGTSAGVTAAVQAAAMGKKVLLISAIGHVGGLTGSGLGACDVNNPKALGGLSKEFFKRVYQYYNRPEVWLNSTREQYFKAGNLIWGGKNEQAGLQWMVEPNVAEQIFIDMLREAGVEVAFRERLRFKKGVKKKGKDITAITMESGKQYKGKVFIDATYEGDLMAKAGVSFIIGRESNSVYQESRNGILLNGHIATDSIDPYVKEGDATSGLLPFIEPKAPGKNGEGDHRTQAYCYRFTLSMDTANQLPIEKPANYNAMWYEMLARKIKQDPKLRISDILTLTPVPNKKTDTNHADFVGASYNWPAGDYAARDQLAQLHKDYTLGLLWFCANDERVPEVIRKEMRKYGLAKDEFTDNDHFPYLLYIREARRMVSDYVMTEHEYFGKKTAPESIGLATYRLDTHVVTYYVNENKKIGVEGVPVKISANTYPVSYQSIRPKAKECTNLLVPGCLSSSHSAYSSIRMEPVFMILGQSAGAAACIAIDEHTTVQQVPYEKLQTALLKAKQVLSKEEAR
jgi:rhamnogalacturonyl hydrolase YesR